MRLSQIENTSTPLLPENLGGPGQLDYIKSRVALITAGIGHFTIRIGATQTRVRIRQQRGEHLLLMPTPPLSTVTLN